jgi:hypothetical protein
VDLYNIYTNIPLQTQGGVEEAILSLGTISYKQLDIWDLVNTSARWSSEETKKVSEEYVAEDDDG